VDAFTALDDIEPGLEIIEDALEQSPQRVDLRVALAAAYLACDEVEYALSELEQAAEQTDDLQLLGDIERLILGANNPEFETWLGEIGDKIAAGNAPNHDDLDFLESAKESAPNFVDPYLMLGRGYLLREEATDALETLLDAQKRFPSDPDVLEALASVLWENEEYETALGYLDRGLAAHPQHVPLLTRMGQSMFDTGDVDAARAYLQRAEALSPRHPSFIRARKYIAEQMQDMPDDYTP
jgi:tetratricopeptide (TPR) repeat protein